MNCLKATAHADSFSLNAVKISNDRWSKFLQFNLL